MSFFKKSPKPISAIEKFEFVRTFVRAKTEFLMNNEFNGMSPEDAANKIMYQTMDKAIREKLNAQQNAKVDRINEIKSVMEKLQEEVENGNISEAELQEIMNSEEFKSYTSVEKS